MHLELEEERHLTSRQKQGCQRPEHQKARHRQQEKPRPATTLDTKATQSRLAHDRTEVHRGERKDQYRPQSWWQRAQIRRKAAAGITLFLFSESGLGHCFLSVPGGMPAVNRPLRQPSGRSDRQEFAGPRVKGRERSATREFWGIKKRMNQNIRSVEDALEHPEVFRVSIFGSARTTPGDADYQLVEELAYQLGKREISVVTGGGPGQMEAANKGHDRAASGTNSIGLTVRLPFETEHNDFLDMERHFQRFGNRLDHFMALSNAVIITAGGIGTALELFYTLQLTQVKHICPIPIILLDPMWSEILQWLQGTVVQRGFLSPEDLDNIVTATDAEEALAIVERAKKEFDEGDGDACINSKVYKVTTPTGGKPI